MWVLFFQQLFLDYKALNSFVLETKMSGTRKAESTRKQKSDTYVKYMLDVKYKKGYLNNILSFQIILEHMARVWHIVGSQQILLN